MPSEKREVGSATEATKTTWHTLFTSPICLSGTMMEDVGKDDIQQTASVRRASGRLLEWQCGFRRAPPMVDEIATVVDLAPETSAAGKCCAVLTVSAP